MNGASQRRYQEVISDSVRLHVDRNDEDFHIRASPGYLTDDLLRAIASMEALGLAPIGEDGADLISADGSICIYFFDTQEEPPSGIEPHAHSLAGAGAAP